MYLIWLSNLVFHSIAKIVTLLYDLLSLFQTLDLLDKI